MAIIFQETFESGSTPWSFTSVGTRYGNGTATLDTSSKGVGTNSLKILTTSSGGDTSADAQKDLGSTYTDLYVQFRIRLAAGFTFGANGYLGMFALRTSGGADVMYCNMEDYGSPQLVPSGGTVGYRPSGVSLTVNTLHRIEIRLKVSATVGNVSIWKDNTVEGSPDFNTGNINSGTTAFQVVANGNTYCPDTTGDYFLDNVIYSTTFIGSSGDASTTTNVNRLTLLGVG